MMNKIKKVYTKEQRYIMAMQKKGFYHKKFWVHEDDYEQVKEYITKLRDKRLKGELYT